MKSKVWCGNNIEVLKGFPDNHFDSIVTDPPYGIDFLGKSWDANTGALETYEQCLRVLKPGGHIIAFSAARTYHHLAVTIEQAGFEIRDQIMWIYGSGFPKSQDIGRQIDKRTNKTKLTTTLPNNDVTIEFRPKNVCGSCGKSNNGTNHLKCEQDNCNLKELLSTGSNEWSGWGTALKPAHEPCVLARKPISERNIADNCIKHGTGALNIDATRVEYDEADTSNPYLLKPRKAGVGIKKYGSDEFVGDTLQEELDANQFYAQASSLGRFPANIIHDGSDEVVSMFPYSKDGTAGKRNKNGSMFDFGAHEQWGGYEGEGSAARFFYCPKVSRKERHIGHEDALKDHGRISPKQMYGSVDEDGVKEDMHKQGQMPVGLNNHPTVKPIELMKYLIKLVTVPGGRVLDPFNGSGSTGCAAVEMDYDYTGIDLDPNYVAISEKRIQAWYDQTHQPINVLFKEE